MKHFTKQLDTTKFILMQYSIFLQVMRELFAEESYLWWIVLLANTCEQDETSANITYARLEHLRSSSESLLANFQNGANSGSAESGLASGVSSSSASLISDYEGREYQRIEYTPYGETWVERTSNTGMEYLPYKFTGKERDEETGLYYFGARYLDAKYSRWMSADPALGEYVPTVGNDNNQLPNGGAYNYVNFSLYHYGANNPVRYTDPTGAYDVDDETKTIYCDINDSTDVHSAYKAFVTLSHLDGYKSCVATDSETGSSVTFNSTQAMGQMIEAMRTDDGSVNLASLFSIASDAATVGGVISPEALGNLSKGFSYAGLLIDFVNVGRNLYDKDANGVVNSGVDVAISVIGIAGGAQGAIASIGLKYAKVGLEVGAEKLAESTVKFNGMAEAYVKDKMLEQMNFRYGR